MSRKRKEDAELWERVKRTAKPLHSNRARKEFKNSLGEIETPSSQPMRPPTKILRPYSREPKVQFAIAPKPPLLDSSTTRKISKGRMSIDARIDLHGFTQAEAHSRLKQFLGNAHFRGHRTILIITGKGVGGEGILRHAVPRWLQEPEFRQIVSGYHEAHVSHGGSGALYVRVRKKVDTRAR